jgi:hypothetical protein
MAKGVDAEIDSDPTPNSSGGTSMPVGKDGSFEFWGLDPGTYRMRGQSADGLRSAGVAVEVATTNIEHLEFRLLPPFDVTGRVEFEDDRAREASKVVEEGPPRFTRTVFLGDEVGSSYPRTQIGEDDSFLLEHVPPGLYKASVALGHTFVRAARLGNAPSDDDTVDLRVGSHGDPLTLMLSADWAEVTGTVSDSNGPVAVAIVEMIQDRFSRNAQTDANGHYSFPDVPPCKYQLLAEFGSVAQTAAPFRMDNKWRIRAPQVPNGHHKHHWFNVESMGWIMTL